MMYKDIIIKCNKGVNGFYSDIIDNKLSEFIVYDSSKNPKSLSNGISIIWPHWVDKNEPTIAYLRCSEYAWDKLKNVVWTDEKVLAADKSKSDLYSQVKDDVILKAEFKEYLPYIVVEKPIIESPTATDIRNLINESGTLKESLKDYLSYINSDKFILIEEPDIEEPDIEEPDIDGIQEFGKWYD